MQSVAKLDERFEAWGLAVERRWAYGGDFPESLDGYAGIFLSGSPHGAYDDVPFIHREHELIRAAAARGTPMLGICFGSQILASALCGRDQVFRRTSCEVGYRALPVAAAARQDPLCGELGASVEMFVWHNDEVRADHPEMEILAWSEDCPNHIWRHRDRPVWGIQGHPELTAAEARVWFEQNRNRLEADGADVETLKVEAAEAREAKTMLRRFATLLAG